MSYAAAIDHLSALIPELLSTPGQPRRKFSLEEIRQLCTALGNPQRQFPAVLIAGTNGKGSTASTLASIARESGLRVGLYTSPHLDRVNERIRLLLPDLLHPGQSADPDTGQQPASSASGTGLDVKSEIPDETFARLYFQVHDTAQQLILDGALAHLPSYFELLTALAFLYFTESQVDLAVLEVGMGGRLDATNIVDPILSVITDISLDHQEWLGSTIDLIAREKAGILRPNGVLITLPQHPEANQALGEIATALNVRAINAARYTPQIGASPIAPYPIEVLGAEILVDSPLKGAHQHRNLALAIAAAVELAQTHGFPMTASAIERGIHHTHWPGRLESIQLPNQPEIILDVAHNPAGAWALRAALNASPAPESRTHLTESGPSKSGPVKEDAPSTQCLIFGCLRDKPLAEMTQILFPIFDHVILAPIHSPRATPVADLVAAAQAVGIPSTVANTVEEAIEAALRLSPLIPGRIVISGSVYLVGEARHHLFTQPEPGNLSSQDSATDLAAQNLIVQDKKR